MKHFIALATLLMALPGTLHAAVGDVSGMLYSATQFAPSTGDIDGWNQARLAYKATERVSVSLNQVFLTDYRTRRGGLGARLDDAFFMSRTSDVFAVPALGLKGMLENRLILPVSETSRARELNFGTWNRLFATFKFSKNLGLTFEESFQLHWHRRDGGLVSGRQAANELFRNFLAATPTVSFGALSAHFPVYLQNSRFRAYSGDPKGGTWVTKVFLWPSVSYTLTPNVTLGANCLTGNLLADGAFRDLLTAAEVTFSL